MYPCSIWGRYLCLGLSPLANPAPSFSPNLLSESSALHLLLWWKPLGQNGRFLAEAGNPVSHLCEVWLCFWGGCMGFCRRLLASCFFSTFPWIHRCFRRSMSLMKVWSQIRWLILYMKTQYLWQLNSTSKIKRIPLFQQLSWLFAYLNAWRVLGIVT